MKNLKFILLLFIVSSVFETSHAQISIGPKVGLNYSTFGGDNSNGDGISYLIGVQFGAVAQINFNEQFAFQPELLYFQKGAKSEFFDAGFNFEIDKAINYLEVPLLAKYMFGDTEATQFYLIGGPSIGIGLNVNIITEEGEEESEETVSFEDQMLNRLDIALSFGGGVQFPLGPGELFVDARYLFGLTSVDDSNTGTDFTNQGIGLSAGFLYTIRGDK